MKIFGIVPWQPCALSGWPAIQAKYVFEISLGKMLQPAPNNPDDIEVPYIKAVNVQWSGINAEDLPTMWANLSEVKALNLNVSDLLVCEGGEVGRASILGNEPPANCIYQNALHRVRSTNSDVRYLKYCLKQASEAGWFDVLCNRATIAHFTSEKFRDLHVHIPPLETQRLIADYLDRETARIDALVAEKERMLELLEEKRAALISQAVTRGLNPDVPLKPSGLDWLGEIPARWEKRRLKYLTRSSLDYGANEAALEENPDWPRFVRITDIDEDGRLRGDTFRALPPEIAESYLLEQGDILFARSGATVGKTFIYRQEWGKACFAGYLIRFRSDPSIVDPYFIYYFSLSKAYKNQLESGTIQATIQNFSAEKYADLFVCIPPLPEQRAIVRLLKKEADRTSAAREKVCKSIELFKERRAALITAAVTGQIPLEEMYP